VEWSEQDAKRAEENAQREASNRPELLAQAIGEGSGIDPNAILRFLSEKPDDELTKLAHRLAGASGVKYDDLVEFLNGQLRRGAG
jgi:hypothetical protein